MERLKNLIGRFLLNRQKRRMEPASVEFPGALSRIKQVLICLPGELRELTTIKQFLPTIQEMFDSADITLLALPGVAINGLYPRKGFQVLSPSSDAITWCGLPSKQFIKKLQEQKFDLVLDMNLTWSRFTAGVLLAFPAAVRAGRGNHLGAPYYNLEIRTRYLRDERNIYRSLLRTLGRMKDSAEGRPVAEEQPINADHEQPPEERCI